MNKRLFLQQTLAASLQLPGFLNRQALAASSELAHRRLVLVELAGANDGLNTLVPYTNDHYYRLRPTLGLSEASLFKLDDELALHSALQPLMPFWESGDLAWVQGLGYPTANRSHFKSIALWETAGDGRSSRGDRGWMTHAIEHQLARSVKDPHGISLAGDMSIFASESGRWLSIANARQIQKYGPADPTSTMVAHPTLAIVQQRLKVLNSTISQLTNKLERVEDLPRFDGGAFGEQLRQVAMFVAAGVDTPVYRVRLNGFDTHDYQLGRHSQLLSTLAEGLGSFASALKQMNEWQNTLVMSYSEFGRRAAENSSSGTDHGTAAPHLMMGGAVNGGLYGASPDLCELIDGDPTHTMDYRAVYHQIMLDGLGLGGSSRTLSQYRDSRLEGVLRPA